jgi:hypothetical protein
LVAHHHFTIGEDAMGCLTVCAMTCCPRLTRGNWCSRHRTLTPDQLDAEGRELRARHRAFESKQRHVRTLREAGDPGLERAEHEAEQARLHMAELFGEGDQ